MAQCVFCGDEAAFGKTIKFEDFSFRACARCYDSYSMSTQDLIMKAVQKAGIYKYMGDVSAWLEKNEAEKAEKRNEKIAKLREYIKSYEEWRTGRECGACPKCGGSLLKQDPVEFVAYVGGLLTTNISMWNTTSLDMEMHCCEDCGYTEFYDTAAKKRRKAYLQNKEELEELLRKEEEQRP